MIRGPFWVCARHEFMLAVRSKWTAMFGATFAALALGVALAGYWLTGGQGLQDFARTAASLVELVVVLVPVSALLFGVLSLTPDRGGAELLYSQPASRATILAGTVAGLWAALAAAELAGLGLSGIVVFWRTGDAGFASLAGVALAAVALTGVFLGLAALVSAGATGAERARALAVALSVWFGLVMLYDAAAMAAASFLPSAAASRLLMTAVVLNPVDAARTATLMGVEGTAAFGGASLAFLRFTGGATGAFAWLLVSIALWVAWPLALAIWRLRRADL
jgi:Cu-processing system permease protein